MNPIDSIAGGVSPITGGLGRGRIEDGGEFERLLGVASAAREHSSQTGPAERAREGAERLVAMTFIEPMLRSIRESSQAAPPFAPTAAEKQFGTLLDAQVAHQVVRSARLPIVDRIAGDLLARVNPA